MSGLLQVLYDGLLGQVLSVRAMCLAFLCQAVCWFQECDLVSEYWTGPMYLSLLKRGHPSRRTVPGKGAGKQQSGSFGVGLVSNRIPPYLHKYVSRANFQSNP